MRMIKYYKMKYETFRNTKRQLCILCPLFIALIFLGSCSKDDTDTDPIGNWFKVSDFEGVPRTDAVAFTIGDKAYLATGYDGEDRYNDLWEYDSEKDFWQQKSQFPGLARNGAVAFGTENKGYIGTGYDGYEKLKDFWEYDPISNEWTQKADFAGSARYGAVSFSIANKGYIGTGYDGNTLKDFWQYNPESDAWTQIVSIGGSKRRDAVSFVINGMAYVGTGLNNGSYISDFWAYDPSKEAWTQKRNLANTSEDAYDDDYNIIGINGAAFTFGARAYVACSGQGTVSNEIWEYEPSTDLWEKKTSFEGSGRIEAVGFSVNNKGFIATGRNSSYYFDDIWEFRPDETYNAYD